MFHVMVLVNLLNNWFIVFWLYSLYSKTLFWFIYIHIYLFLKKFIAFIPFINILRSFNFIIFFSLLYSDIICFHFWWKLLFIFPSILHLIYLSLWNQTIQIFFEFYFSAKDAISKCQNLSIFHYLITLYAHFLYKMSSLNQFFLHIKNMQELFC
jgi:hypothetical protein